MATGSEGPIGPPQDVAGSNQAGSSTGSRLNVPAVGVAVAVGSCVASVLARGDAVTLVETSGEPVELAEQAASAMASVVSVAGWRIHRFMQPNLRTSPCGTPAAGVVVRVLIAGPGSRRL